MSCIGCDDSFKKYGFSIVIGMKIFTQSEKACCPTRGIITSFDHINVKFRTLDGREHSKPFNEFMKSSWCDKSLY